LATFPARAYERMDERLRITSQKLAARAARAAQERESARAGHTQPRHDKNALRNDLAGLQAENDGLCKRIEGLERALCSRRPERPRLPLSLGGSARGERPRGYVNRSAGTKKARLPRRLTRRERRGSGRRPARSQAGATKQAVGRSEAEAKACRGSEGRRERSERETWEAGGLHQAARGEP